MMLTLEEDEFKAHFADDDFCEYYGNPVRVRLKSGRQMQYASATFAEKEQDRIKELELHCTEVEEEAKVKYWLIDFNMPKKDVEKLQRIAASYEMTPDEYFDACLEHFLNSPEERKAFKEEYDRCMANGTPLDEHIQVLREFPVLKGETEMQARKKCVAGLCGTVYAVEDSVKTRENNNSGSPESDYRKKKEMNGIG